MNLITKNALNGIIMGIFFMFTIFGVVYAATIVSVTTQNIYSDDIISQGWFQDVNNKLITLSGASTIPTGAVMAFNLSSCPTGWIIANGTNGTPDLRGEFIRGLDDGRGVDTGRTLASFQTGTLLPHIGVYRTNSTAGALVTPAINAYAGDGTSIYPANYESSVNVTSPYFSVNLSPTGNTNASYFRVRPRNVALLYCVKN